jgi:hypothetical protein
VARARIRAGARASPERPAFYAVGAGRLGDLVTLLHPPYTAWHLSYFVLGAAVAPHVQVGRLLWGLLAFFLAVGIAAHALDELHDRPLATAIGDRVLLALTVAGIAGALAIGVAGAVVVTPWLIPFVIAGAVFVPAYNLELIGGRLHGDTWFAVGWGAFPALTGYFIEARAIGLPGVLVALACLLLSVAQRRLSTPARELRRRTVSVTGARESTAGDSEPLTRAGMLAPLDGALQALAVAIVVLACAVLAARL